MIVAHHVVFALAVAALGGAGLRLAGRLGARGLELVVAAAPLAAAAAVIWALGLGLLDLGGSTLALAAGAGLTWVAARLLVADDPAPRRQFADWWTKAAPATRIGLLALAAMGVGLCVWQLRHPFLDLDGAVYHLGLPGSWRHSGNPGAVVGIVEGMPVGNYPITYEVLVGWALGLSQSWVIASIVTPAFAALLAIAIWTGLRSLDVPALVAALGVAALLTLPVGARQFGGPLNDLSATAWLATAAALVVLSLPVPERARGPRPLLLVPAVIAAGLAVGTKTTPILLAALVLGFAAWRHRGALRTHAAPLAAAVLVALIVCAIWPLRNLIEHGSPLWPFVSTSWGDPVPPKLKEIEASFISHPAEVLRGRTGAYAEFLGGALLLLPAAFVLALVRRSRLTLALAGATALAVLLWMNAPYTGIDQSTGLAITTTRYMLPLLLAATAAIALSARGEHPRLRAAAIVVFAVSVIVSLVRLAGMGFPFVPSWKTMVLAAVLGAGAALLIGRRRPPSVAWVAPLLVVLAGLGLAAAAPGYAERHAATFAYPGYPGLYAALRLQPGYNDDSRPVAMGPYTFAPIGGDRLRHEVSLVPRTEPCEDVRARARRGWLIIVRIEASPVSTLGVDEAESRRLQACMTAITPRARIIGDDISGYDLYGPAE
ncbi:hypothetical protein BH20ACT17_BH20ACT17_16520 [soil metagenome]